MTLVQQGSKQSKDNGKGFPGRGNSRRKGCEVGRDKLDMFRKCNEGKHQKRLERALWEMALVRKQGADKARLRRPWKDFRPYSK